MPEMSFHRRIEITYVEPFYTAETASYLLQMKKVKDFAPTGRKGWMGAIYFRHGELNRPSFKANTDMYEKREEALAEGTDLMNKYQTELDEAVAKAK